MKKSVNISNSKAVEVLLLTLSEIFETPFRSVKSFLATTMKGLFIIVFCFFSFAQEISAQNATRKPAISLFVNGKMYSAGDEITVNKGQLLEIKALQKGGRRDFVKFPDTYAKNGSDFQVFCRKDDRLIYIDNGIKSEWKLLSENASFASDNQLTIHKSPVNSNEATVRVGIGDFVKTYLKIELSTIWQYTANDEQKLEKNNAELIVYFNVDGVTDTWFVSKNINALGMSDNVLKAKLEIIQNNFDSIEMQLMRLDYSTVQHEIRRLQASVNSLTNALSDLKARNEAFTTEIHISGLPSDRPISHLETLEKMQNHWTKIGNIVVQPLPQGNDLSKDKRHLKSKMACRKYLDWQYSLPEDWQIVMGIYLPKLNSSNILMPAAIQASIEGNQIGSEDTCLKLQAFFKTKRRKHEH